VVRACDWDNDGNTDLIATYERVAVNYFRNLKNNFLPSSPRLKRFWVWTWKASAGWISAIEQ